MALWLALHIGGQRWGVHLVSSRSKHLVENGERLLGCTYQDDCRIYISRDLSEQAREELLMHELLHAVLHVSGAALVIGSCKKEEDIVRDLVPIWHRLFKDLGFRFPRGLYA